MLRNTASSVGFSRSFTKSKSPVEKPTLSLSCLHLALFLSLSAVFTSILVKALNCSYLRRFTSIFGKLASCFVFIAQRRVHNYTVNALNCSYLRRFTSLSLHLAYVSLGIIGG